MAKEGTFDSVLCGEMEVLINYKHKKKGKKALVKRERDSIVLPLFRKDGELWRQREKTAREMVSGVGKEVESPHCKANPPPYNTGLSEEGNSRDPEPLRGTTASGHMDW